MRRFSISTKVGSASGRRLVFAILIAAGVGGLAHAAPDPRDGDIATLKLGLHASELPTGAYIDFACGTNGGPPGRPLSGWTDFASCPPEPTGLHEVHFRFDDELELWARSNDYRVWGERFAGTRLAGHPVILSLLFDDDGIVDGIRIVTDPRADILHRKMAHLFAQRLMARYDRDGWVCVDRSPAPGETAVADLFIKRHCEKVYNQDRQLILEVNLYRKPGQTGIDPVTGAHVPGEFESSTRLNIYDLDVQVAP